jgi:hypothetical protein
MTLSPPLLKVRADLDKKKSCGIAIKPIRKWEGLICCNQLLIEVSMPKYK